MNRFQILARGVDVSAVAAELAARPDLWDRDPERTAWPGSPFAGTSDIWVRGLPRADLKRDRSLVGRPHASAFYPAWRRLPALRALVRGILAAERPIRVGGILVSRVPPGGRIATHADGGWHPTFYHRKVHVAIASNPGCWNTSVDEEFSPLTGDLFAFDNTLPHAVRNEGGADRLTAIVCLRTERGPGPAQPQGPGADPG